MDIMAALSALSSSINLGRTAIALRDQKLIDEAVSELNQKVLQVTQSALELLEQRHAAVEEAASLREKHRKLEAMLSDLAQYEPYQTKGGAICLRPKPDAAESKLTVYVCANCAAAGKKTYLQPQPNGHYLECPNGHDRIPSDTPYEADRIDHGRRGGSWMA